MAAQSRRRIHFAQRHVAGGIIAFLCGGTGYLHEPSGDISGVITPAEVIGPNGQGIEPGSFAEAVRAVRAGATYSTFTTRWPAGRFAVSSRSADGATATRP